MFTLRLFIPAALLSTVLSGCASLPADYGRGDVTVLLQERGRDTPWAGDAAAIQQILNELSGKPLAVNDAVRLALVNNPALNAEYARLGFAAAEVYDAGRLHNPSLSAAVLATGAAGFVDERSFGFVQSFTSILLLPARSRFAEAEFERVKQAVGAQILNLASDTEAAYYRLAGAWQTVTMRETVVRAAQASADLAQRFFDAGNINRLELALEQAAASQAQLDVLVARVAVTVARGALNRLMGLSATEDSWKVSDRLPAPLEDEDPLPDLLKSADTSRLDLAVARKRVSLFADALGVTRRFRYIGEIDVGVETTRIAEGARLTGPTLSLELPIFNQGEGRVARAEAALQEAEAELRSLEVEISNGVKSAAAEVAAAKARTGQYRQSLIPLREAIVARTQEQVNFMLVGQFELLLAKQQEYDAYQGYLEAVRDYWLARVELSRQAGAALPSSARIGEAALDWKTLITPESGGMNGTNHPDGDMSGKDMPQNPSDKSQTGDHP